MAALARGATSAGAAAPPGEGPAAGSLRPPVGKILAVRRQRPGPRFEALCGPFGKLRRLIERGEPVTVFLSASIARTGALKSAGKLKSGQPFVGNALCLMAAPGRKVTAETAADVMLDPLVRLGTSTPKALELTGGAVDRQPTELPYAAVFRDGSADVFVSHCADALATPGDVPGLTGVLLPDPVNVGAVYDLGVAAEAPPGAQALADFIVGPEGRAILERHGFAATPR